MLQTIQTGTHISIQGEFVRRYEDGRIMVRVGQAYHVGHPISQGEQLDALEVATA